MSVKLHIRNSLILLHSDILITLYLHTTLRQGKLFEQIGTLI